MQPDIAKCLISTVRPTLRRTATGSSPLHKFRRSYRVFLVWLALGADAVKLALQQDSSPSDILDDSSSRQEDMGWSSWSRRPSRAGFGAEAAALCGGSEVDFARAAGGSVYSS